ncbi:MAG TPA: transposase [Geminocystis sp. M7585_C2015_104]|nr:transposase [Geminocystis sp. M7585_C2015_104]
MVVILDNFASHRSSKVRERANALGIVLVYLPPYSPDL